jgi:hypothetical protein
MSWFSSSVTARPSALTACQGRRGVRLDGRLALTLRPAFRVPGRTGLLLGPLDRLAVLRHALTQVDGELGGGGGVGDRAAQHGAVLRR